MITHPAATAYRAALALMLVLVVAWSPAVAVQPDEIMSDPALEHRARAISSGLRCLVCQNQSIDDSDAPLAKDLRLLVRQRLKAGDSDDDVRAFLVARYGEFVLLKPPFSAKTVLLWFAPLLLLLGAIYAAMRTVFARAPAAATTTAPLTADERKALDELVNDDREARARRDDLSPPA